MKVSVGFYYWNESLSDWVIQSFRINILDFKFVIRDIKSRLRSAEDFKVDMVFRFDKA